MNSHARGPLTCSLAVIALLLACVAPTYAGGGGGHGGGGWSGGGGGGGWSGGGGGGWHGGGGGGNWSGGGGSWHGGDWHGGWRGCCWGGRVFVGVGPWWGSPWGWWGSPWWGSPWWGAPWGWAGSPGWGSPYASPNPFPSFAAAGMESSPPMFTEQAAPQFWYYCQSPAGYYPYVASCPTAWIQVAPQPAPTTQ